MIVKIKNFGGIGELETEIEEGKINYIYGPSGSGKTSLVNAFTATDVETNKKIGGKTPVEVEIIPAIKDKSSISRFDEESVRHLLVEKDENEEFYRVLFSEGENIDELRKEAALSFSEINSKNGEMTIFIQDVDNLIKRVNGRAKISGSGFAKSSLISKLEGEITSANYAINCKTIKEKGREYINWLEQGIELKQELYSDGKCPFCQRKLTEYKKRQIEFIMSINMDNYKMLYEAEDDFKKLGIELPEYSKLKNLDKTKDNLIKLLDLRNEVQEIINKTNVSDYGNLNPSNFIEIKCSSQFKKQFPEVASIITKLNTEMIDIKKKMTNIGKTTINLIRGNLAKLNTYLEKLNIPYRFTSQKFSSSTRTASFVLTHIDDESKEDRRTFMSNGEKNLIALLLFICSKNGKIIIVDDPASSYDENRRKIIMDLITEKHKGETIFVLSHDQVFIKYAVLSKYDSRKPNTKIGNIGCVENINGKCNIKDIKKESFANLEKQIKDFIKKHPSMSYYRKIINYRLLAELKCPNNQKIYGYLSAILHMNSKDDVYNAISISEAYTGGSAVEREEESIKLIDKKLGENLEPVPDNYLNDFDFNELTKFEQAIFLRESKRNKRGKGRKSEFEKELDDIVHMNNGYFISLNPYEYSTFSPNVHSEIKKYIEEMEGK